MRGGGLENGSLITCFRHIFYPEVAILKTFLDIIPNIISYGSLKKKEKQILQILILLCDDCNKVFTSYYLIVMLTYSPPKFSNGENDSVSILIHVEIGKT